MDLYLFRAGGVGAGAVRGAHLPVEAPPFGRGAVTENGDFGKRSTSNRSKIRLSSGARHHNDVVIT